MRLTELEPEWICDASLKSFRRTGNPAEAQGIMFACPYCFQKNGGLIGTHSILIWFAGRGVPDECEPTPRWEVVGFQFSFDALTLHPSINLQTEQRPDEWHGWVTGGEIK